jgi:exodeoxyribonuclease-5
VKKPSEYLQQQFPFTPTAGQLSFFAAADEFLVTDAHRPCLLLNGYAGTGKTTVIGALVQVLRPFDLKPILLAPTGRAAKVFSGYARRRAFTIHKLVFKPEEEEGTGRTRFVRQKNTHKKTVFLVDEASMIGERPELRNSGLLYELINFVFEDPEAGNRLMLIGDVAQLPPVMQERSFALDRDYLKERYQLSLYNVLLQEVVRQQQESGILANATHVREQLAAQQFQLQFISKPYPDIFRMTRERLDDGLQYAYGKFGVENTAIICRSNKTATQYNHYIRKTVHLSESQLQAGDLLMVVKNNYYWVKDTPIGFLANGEFMEVQSVLDGEVKYNMNFADIKIRLPDYPEAEMPVVKVHLSTLDSFTPNLQREELQQLSQLIMADYAQLLELDLPDENADTVQTSYRADPFLNALQVKFAYALTCHKAQGGQWDAVFIDMGYLPNNEINNDFLRWVYTAITRAKEQVYLVSFAPEMFG